MTETSQLVKKSSERGIKETDVSAILGISRGIQEGQSPDYLISQIQGNAFSDRSIKTLLKKAIKSKGQHNDKIRIIEHLLM